MNPIIFVSGAGFNPAKYRKSSFPLLKQWASMISTKCSAVKHGANKRSSSSFMIDCHSGLDGLSPEVRVAYNDGYDARTLRELLRACWPDWAAKLPALRLLQPRSRPLPVQLVSKLQQAILTSWSFPLGAALSLLATGAVYVLGYSKIRLTRPHLFPAWRLYCFLAGLGALWIALASPLDTLNEYLLSAHMAQHLMLMSVVPPLLLLGAPAVPLLRGLPRGLVRDGLGPLFRSHLLRQAIRTVTHPVFAWVALNIVFVAWHIPQAYELALRSPPWHSVEHAGFLITSLLFWFPVIQPWPSVSRGSRWLLLPYLLTADLVNTALSAFLVFSGKLLYPSYSAAAQVFGVSPLNDQAAAGALMWVVGSVSFLVPLVVITMRLLSPSLGRPVLLNE